MDEKTNRCQICKTNYWRRKVSHHFAWNLGNVSAALTVLVIVWQLGPGNKPRPWLSGRKTWRWQISGKCETFMKLEKLMCISCVLTLKFCMVNLWISNGIQILFMEPWRYLHRFTHRLECSIPMNWRSVCMSNIDYKMWNRCNFGICHCQNGVRESKKCDHWNYSNECIHKKWRSNIKRPRGHSSVRCF